MKSVKAGQNICLINKSLLSAGENSIMILEEKSAIIYFQATNEVFREVTLAIQKKKKTLASIPCGSSVQKICLCNW